MYFNNFYPQVNAHVLFWSMLVFALLMAWAVHQWVEKPFAPSFKKALQWALRIQKPCASALDSTQQQRG